MAGFTKERVDELLGLCEAATPGPWRASGLPYDGFDDPKIFGPDGVYVAQTVYGMQAITQEHNIEPDTVFIAAASTALPEALDEIERLQAANREAVTIIGNTARAQGYAEAEVERLRAGIKALIEGEPHRDCTKNSKCRHGQYGFEACDQCLCEYLQRLLGGEVK